MSLLLLLGGAGTAVIPGGVEFEGLGASLIFQVSASPPYDEVQDWHDLTEYLLPEALTTDRGRSSEFDDIRTGTLTVDLDASNGDLDRRNPASPHADCLKARRRCRFLADVNGVQYPVFYGFSHGFPRIYNRPNTKAIVPFQASEGFRVMGSADPTTGLFRLGDPDTGRLGVGRLGGSTAASQMSGELIAALADSVGWPSDLRNIATGQVMVDGDLGSRRAPAAMQEANTAEGGDLYFDRTGKLTFRDRLARYTDTRSVTAQATFSPQASDPPSYDQPLRIEHDDTRFINDATYTGISGIPQNYRDSSSFEENGIGEDRQSLITVRDGDALSLAVLRVTDYAEPADRIEQLVINCHAIKNRAAAFPAVLSRELFDRVDVVLESTYGADPETIPAVIQGIRHRVTKTSWVTTFRLGAYHSHQFFTLGHPTLGQLGGVGVLAP